MILKIKVASDGYVERSIDDYLVFMDKPSQGQHTLVLEDHYKISPRVRVIRRYKHIKTG